MSDRRVGDNSEVGVKRCVPNSRHVTFRFRDSLLAVIDRTEWCSQTRLGRDELSRPSQLVSFETGLRGIFGPEIPNSPDPDWRLGTATVHVRESTSFRTYFIGDQVPVPLHDGDVLDEGGESEHPPLYTTSTCCGPWRTATVPSGLKSYAIGPEASDCEVQKPGE